MGIFFSYNNTSSTNNTKNNQTKVKNNKKVKKAIPKEIRNQVWIKYHGNCNYGICYCCGNYIYRYNAGWHCAHVHSDVKGGKITVDNLRTCCKHCNLSMG